MIWIIRIHLLFSFFGCYVLFSVTMTGRLSLLSSHAVIVYTLRESVTLSILRKQGSVFIGLSLLMPLMAFYMSDTVFKSVLISLLYLQMVKLSNPLDRVQWTWFIYLFILSSYISKRHEWLRADIATHPVIATLCVALKVCFLYSNLLQ